MHLDPILPVIVEAAFAVLAIGTVLRLLHQPHVVGYLVAGVVLGTACQVAVSVGCAALLGTYLQWPLNRIILMGFVISLSSTAVVFKLLQDWAEFDTPAGQHAVGILLVQDVAVIPMLIALGAMGGRRPDAGQLALQAVGAVVCVGLVVWVAVRGTVHLPMRRLLRDDHEIQVFAALTICFGLATFTGLTGLSTALGAFVAGIVPLVLVTNTAINTGALRLLGTPWRQATVATIALSLMVSPMWIHAVRSVAGLPPRTPAVAGDTHWRGSVRHAADT